jgi:2-hydroxy-3-keto-5-methylthiopentenyl-1-phosphate phosphatase
VRIVIDWDGTVTERDTLMLTLRHFIAPSILEPLEAELDDGLEDGTITHLDVMEREFALLTASLDEVVAFLLERAEVRPGFAEFVERFDPLVLSSSFHQTIEPVLTREGITARLRANFAEPSATGWRIRWAADSDCSTCGEPCKRGSLPDGPFVYVGDGYSDRCAALAAERVFARDGLATYLDDVGVAYEPFVDFPSLIAALSYPGLTSSRQSFSDSSMP